MDTYIIRELNIEDYDKVYALWLKTPGMGLNNLDDSREGIARFLMRNPKTCFVAQKKEELDIVGVIISGHDGRRGYIYHACVEGSYRCQGLGCRLVDAVLEALMDEGINKVALVVFDRNKGGNAFWERLGFIERRDLTYRNKVLVELKRIDT